MGLSKETRQQALSEHEFHNGEFCSRCGVSIKKVLRYWRRGMADLVECQHIQMEQSKHRELNAFSAFRLGYYLGGIDALEEFAAKIKGKSVVRRG